mgnify:CR=1 FL=1|tara:strand:+ start:66 stop:653 length:588 start_codon:yes stop_codon:yes gene_type:complete
MTTIFEVLEKAKTSGIVARANSRNSKRSLRSARSQRKFGTGKGSIPTDEQVKAQAVKDRAARIRAVKESRAAAQSKGKKPASPTATPQPKGKKVKPKVKPSGKFSKEGAAKIEVANVKNERANIEGRTSASAVGRPDSYGSASAAVTRGGRRNVNQSASECRLWKAELVNTFNALLDNYQLKYKFTEEEIEADSV